MDDSEDKRKFEEARAKKRRQVEQAEKNAASLKAREKQKFESTIALEEQVFNDLRQKLAKFGAEISVNEAAYEVSDAKAHWTKRAQRDLKLELPSRMTFKAKSDTKKGALATMAGGCPIYVIEIRPDAENLGETPKVAITIQPKGPKAAPMRGTFASAEDAKNAIRDHLADACP